MNIEENSRKKIINCRKIVFFELNLYILFYCGIMRHVTKHKQVRNYIKVLQYFEGFKK